MRVASPESDELWAGYLRCRYVNLYEPFGLPESVTTSELDTPRVRPDVLHRLVLSDEGSIAAVGRLDLQPEHAEGPSAQLRYCAVDVPFRGRGAGQLLLSSLEEAALERGLGRLWMEAREAALRFYLRMGYRDIGVGPTKWGLIPHRILEKNLRSGGR
ncbi:MAG: GNAT family N-acetyltransferase [Planctomycetota bacterium]|nr:GNAT family N-acetyltransferase [Planctomycetota bacterium]